MAGQWAVQPRDPGPGTRRTDRPETIPLTSSGGTARGPSMAVLPSRPAPGACLLGRHIKQQTSSRPRPTVQITGRADPPPPRDGGRVQCATRQRLPGGPLHSRGGRGRSDGTRVRRSHRCRRRRSSWTILPVRTARDPCTGQRAGSGGGPCTALAGRVHDGRARLAGTPANGFRRRRRRRPRQRCRPPPPVR